MSIKFTKLTKVLVIGTIASLFTIEAKAEMEPLHEAFKDAYFTKGQNAFIQSGYYGQIDSLFGFTGYPEQDINVDGKAVDRVYQEGMKQQAATGMRMVTRDLNNPYDTSLRENPDYSAIK